jgi:hypothetical protein
MGRCAAPIYDFALPRVLIADRAPSRRQSTAAWS